MNSNTFQENLQDFRSSAVFTSSPFSAEPAQKTVLSGLKDIFSSNSPSNGALPFSYADAAHTKPAPAPNSQGTSAPWSSWWPTSGDVLNITGSSPFSISAAPQLSKTQQWLETMGLTRSQRYTAFGICMVAAAFLFLLSMFHLPLVVLRPRKFVVPYCMASLFVLVSFGFLHGFVSYGRHLFSRHKLIYSAWFVLATLGTLYAALSLENYVLSVVMVIVQMTGMMCFVVSYVPGGSTGISFMGNILSSSIRSRFAPNSF